VEAGGCGLCTDAKEMRMRMLKTMSSHTSLEQKLTKIQAARNKKKRGDQTWGLIDVCAVSCCLRRAGKVGVLKFRLKISIWGRTAIWYVSQQTGH